MVTSPCAFYQPRQQRRKARSGKPAILIHISANARAEACGCPCGCGRTLAKDCGCQKPLGLEPNHTGWTAQSLFFLEESRKVNLKLLQKSSQVLKTFFQLLQIKRLQLKLTNTLQNSYQIQSQHRVPRTWVKQHPKRPQTTKTNENPSPSSSMHKLVPFGSKLVPTWFL